MIMHLNEATGISLSFGSFLLEVTVRSFLLSFSIHSSVLFMRLHLFLLSFLLILVLHSISFSFFNIINLLNLSFSTLFILLVSPSTFSFFLNLSFSQISFLLLYTGSSVSILILLLFYFTLSDVLLFWVICVWYHWYRVYQGILMVLWCESLELRLSLGNWVLWRLGSVQIAVVWLLWYVREVLSCC